MREKSRAVKMGLLGVPAPNNNTEHTQHTVQDTAHHRSAARAASTPTQERLFFREAVKPLSRSKEGEEVAVFV